MEQTTKKPYEFSIDSLKFILEKVTCSKEYEKYWEEYKDNWYRKFPWLKDYVFIYKENNSSNFYNRTFSSPLPFQERMVGEQVIYDRINQELKVEQWKNMK
jgi:hypothetical protein